MVAMRRKDRQVSDEEAMAYLKAAEYGVLSTVGPDGAGNECVARRIFH